MICLSFIISWCIFTDIKMSEVSLADFIFFNKISGLVSVDCCSVPVKRKRKGIGTPKGLHWNTSFLKELKHYFILILYMPKWAILAGFLKRFDSLMICLGLVLINEIKYIISYQNYPYPHTCTSIRYERLKTLIHSLIAFGLQFCLSE